MERIVLHEKTFLKNIPEEEISAKIQSVAKELTEDLSEELPLFLGVLNGSFRFFSELMNYIDFPCEISFVKLASYSGTQTSGKVKHLIGLDHAITNRTVVIIEDIVDTGLTLESIMASIKTHRPKQVKIATLLFKPEAYKKDIPIDYVAFKVPNDFLVGFGLDYDGLGRNLNSIYKIESEKKPMLNIILFGPPGAGKGTQSGYLQGKYDLVHLSTGDIFRFNIKEQTELGKLAKTYLDSGKLVPDAVTIDMLKSEVEKHPGCNGFIFDGFPRTPDQANALDEFLKSINTNIGCMLSLEVEKEELTDRMLKRAETSGRTDDADPKVVANRIEVYAKETAPVANHYNKQGKLKMINGMGSINDISERLDQAIAEVL